MDYEKKYNEVLAWAKKYKARLNGVPIEEIFTELRESEDERIRKELKDAFEAYDIESMWNGIPIRSIFAWLEKQKEQKPAWKPSEEQLNALNFAITYFMHETNYKNPTELRDLYDDLLKLKEDEK